MLTARCPRVAVYVSLALCDLLLDEAKVALVAPVKGWSAGHVRLPYALSDDDLEKGLTRIAAVLR